MALINRGKVMIDYLENLGTKDSYRAKYEALEKAVDEAPAVDAKPVVYAHWIANNICSACHDSIKGYAIQNRYEFCPHCGARMDLAGGK